jgi:hypothetical protein
MMTGMYPPRHRVRGNGPMVLPPSARTVAEAARQAGIETAAFVAALALDRAYGIAQGFELYRQPQPWTVRFQGQISERPAAEVVEEALRWWRGRDRSRPFFVWVHVFDPHMPYAPPQPYLEQAGGDPYLGEVAAADAALGELLDALRADGALDEALVMVVGDHGEALGAHGERAHGNLCYDATLRVPFLVRHPDGRRAGEVSQETVSVADVAPTLLEALGLDVPAGLDGRSLLGPPLPDDRGVYFECYAGWLLRGWSPLAGWADAQGKYLHSSVPQLFRPREDPDEQRDLLVTGGGDPAPYRRALAELSARPPLDAGEATLAGAQALEAMAALGYAVTDDVTTEMPPPLAASDRPAPHLSTTEELAYELGSDLVRGGDYASAVPVLRELVEQNPRDALALERLAQALIALERFEQAADVLRRRLRLPPEKIGVHLDLVTCLRALGQDEQAHAHELRSIELRIEVHTRRGEPDQARHWQQQLERAR